MDRIRFGLLMNGMLLFFVTVGAAMVWMTCSSLARNDQDKRVGRIAGWIALATLPIHAFIIWSIETWAK